MASFRFIIARRRPWAALLLAAALLMRLLVPGGYMADTSGGRLSLRLCSGTGPVMMTMVMPGMEHHRDAPDRHDPAEHPCAFAGLAAPGLAGADPIQIALAIAFVVAVARCAAPARRVVTRVPGLRPPPRGPPLAA